MMFKYLGILCVLKGIVSEININYKSDEYTDDAFSFSGEDYVFNDTRKDKPVRVEVTTVNSNVDEDDNATTASIVPPDTKIRSNRDCIFTNSLDVGATDAPVPDPKDTIVTYPFAVSVLRMGSHYASGALVDERWVLTAAGEFYNVRESIKLYRARLGSVNCKKGGTLLPLQQVAIHPSYAPGKPEFDLAMLRLARPVAHSPSVRPVSLTETKGRVDAAKFLTMYWPRIVVNGKPLPATAKERKQHSNLRVSTQRVMSWKQCVRDLGYRKEPLTENNFCLRPLHKHHSICMPDVGAPVVSHDGLWGVVSGWVGEPCSFTDPSPVVVVRVSSPAVRHWLEIQMEHEE